MGLEDKIKATAKTIEGKVQEAVGEMIGDPETKAKGQIKQEEAEALLSQNAEDTEAGETKVLTEPKDKKEEVIEQAKTFEGSDKIEQFTTFEEAKTKK